MFPLLFNRWVCSSTSLAIIWRTFDGVVRRTGQIFGHLKDWPIQTTLLQVRICIPHWTWIHNLRMTFLLVFARKHKMMKVIKTLTYNLFFLEKLELRVILMSFFSFSDLLTLVQSWGPLLFCKSQVKLSGYTIWFWYSGTKIIGPLFQ